MRPEPRRLCECWLERERRPSIAAQFALKVARVNEMLSDDVGREVREIAFVQELHDGVAVWPRRRFPVNSASQMWYRREDVKRLAAVWRHRWISQAGHKEVEREVIGQRLPREDVVEQTPIAPPQQDIVVRQPCLSIAPLRAEIEDEQRHAIRHPLESPIGITAAVRGG